MTDVQATRILEGSFEGTWLQTLVGPSLLMYKGDDLSLVSRYLAIANELGFDKARHYVLGLSAFCSFATRGAVTGDFGADGHVRGELDRIRDERPSAIGLGRLKSPAHSRLGLVDAKMMELANKITWSRPPHLGSDLTGSRDVARQRCASATAAAFPDQMDSREFDLLVSPLLYSRLDTMTANLRTATSAALSISPFSTLLTDAGRTTAASKIAVTKVRIPGAPRLTWAGTTTNFQRPTLTSEDGALVILLKQAKALFLDRMRLAVQQRSVCDHPPSLDLWSGMPTCLRTPCIVILPGSSSSVCRREVRRRKPLLQNWLCCES